MPANAQDGSAAPENGSSYPGDNKNKSRVPHQSLLNPCSVHPYNEISYLDKTTKMGACEECLPDLARASHELMPIKQTIEEVSHVLSTLDEQIQVL